MNIFQHESNQLTPKTRSPTGFISRDIVMNKLPMFTNVHEILGHVHEMFIIYALKPRKLKMKHISGQSKIKNLRSCPFRGNFFFKKGHLQKTPLNPYRDWVYDLILKSPKKRKKLPFGNFLTRLVSFFKAKSHRHFLAKTSNGEKNITQVFAYKKN